MAVALSGCSQPVEVGDASSTEQQPETTDAPPAAGGDAAPIPGADPGEDPEANDFPGAGEPAAEEIAAPAPTPLATDEPDREPAGGPSGLVASPDDLDAFFGGSTPAADADPDDRYGGAASPPIPSQPSDVPAPWQRDAADSEPDASVSEFFGDMMGEPPVAENEPAPETEDPLAGLPRADEPPAPAEDPEDALGAFLAQPDSEEEPAAEPAPADTPAEPPSDGFPFVDMPAEPPTETPAETEDELPPFDFPPLSDPPAEEPAPAVEETPPVEPPTPPADDVLPEWSPVRPLGEEPLNDPPAADAADDQPSILPMPADTPAATPDPAPTELPPPTLPREPGDPLPPPPVERIPPKRPTPNLNNTRQLAWLLGAKLGMMTAGDSAPKAWELEGLSETLGIEPVDIDTSGDAARATSRLLKASGTLGKRLAKRYGSDHAALLEIAVKSNALAALIGDHPKLAEPVATAIEQAAERSGLDPELMRPLVQTLRANPTPQEAREAVFQLHDAMASELESEG